MNVEYKIKEIKKGIKNRPIRINMSRHLIYNADIFESSKIRMKAGSKRMWKRYKYERISNERGKKP